jgi:predicted DsbA family dithiol-disulfide isomerase
MVVGVNVAIWSDVVCPWCYIGKRHFEAALADFEHRDEVSRVWRSFQLDPRAPAVSEGDPLDRLAAKYGMTRAQAEAAQARVTATAAAAGLDFHLDRARSGNTFDAHRLLHHAASVGHQDALKERLMAAYFTEGEAIGDRGVLVRLAGAAGLDCDAASAVLHGDDFAEAVHGDVQTARELGITGVPFFVIDGRYGISGAQPAEVILSALRRAWSAGHTLEPARTAASDVACADGSCPA